MNHTANPRRSRRFALAGLLALTGVACIVAAPSAAPAAKKKTTVKVMTRNLYLGAELDRAITAPTPEQAYAETGEILDRVYDTNFDARVKPLVAEIKAKKPDLIGMQEVALWRKGQFGAPDSAATPATEVVFDYLTTLKEEMRKQDLDYKAVMVQPEADIEFPVDSFSEDVDGNRDYGATDGTPDFDGRLTMRDVIFAKKGLKISNAKGANYDTRLDVTLPLGTVSVKRGFARVDVKKGDEKFRFVDTHFESFAATTRNAQALELVADGGPLDTDKPVILVGDLNSDPAGNTDSSTAYNTVVGAGYKDRGVTEDTCCFSELLRDDDLSNFHSRIDHVLVSTNKIKGLSSSVIGKSQSERTGQRPLADRSRGRGGEARAPLGLRAEPGMARGGWARRLPTRPAPRL